MYRGCEGISEGPEASEGNCSVGRGRRLLGVGGWGTVPQESLSIPQACLT